jgi:hypothetical protein
MSQNWVSLPYRRKIINRNTLYIIALSKRITVSPRYACRIIRYTDKADEKFMFIEIYFKIYYKLTTHNSTVIYVFMNIQENKKGT